MTVYYTTAAKLAAYLQRPAFSTITTPTTATVESYIGYAESEIERITGTAWKAVSISNEIHKMRHKSGCSMYQKPYVELDYRPVRSFTITTDKIEVWNGSSWVDWVATKTEGRDKDYWVDYAEGRIYFAKSFPMIGWEEGVRVTYRYGESTVAGWVEELATMMAAVRVLEADMGVTISNEGGGSDSVPVLTQDSRIRIINNEIIRRLDEAKYTVRQRRFTII